MDDPLGKPWGTVGPSFTAKLSPHVIFGKTLVDAQQDYVPVRVRKSLWSTKNNLSRY